MGCPRTRRDGAADSPGCGHGRHILGTADISGLFTNEILVDKVGRLRASQMI